MYDRNSVFQIWRQWDIFNLVPFGAFFSPSVPQTEFSILVRDVLPNDHVTPWTESPLILPRRWWHALWNPQKHLYRAKLDVARALLVASTQASMQQDRLPVTFLFSDPYLVLLQYAINLPRLSKPKATQFAVVEIDVLTRDTMRSVVSALHEV